MVKRTVAVIDGNSLMHRAFHALPETMTAPDGRPTNAVFGFVSMMVKMVQDLKPEGVVVAFDRGKPAFRTEALEQYKIHRPPTADSLRAQFPMVKELLGALSVPVIELDGWEGDDILGTLARRGEGCGLRMLLVTGDRDAFQLVTDDVHVVTTRKGITDITIMGPAEVLDRYGVTPAQVPDYLGLKGDTSDNIPGVPGVGEKTAAKLMQQFGTMEAVLEAAQAGEIPGKIGENLRENVDKAEASRTVATIVCDVPVEIDLEATTFGDFDLAEVARVFGEYRFTTLLERVLALKGAKLPAETSSVPVERAVVECPACIAGLDAGAAVARWLQAGDGWLGVAYAGAADTLFEESKTLAVAGVEATALVENRADKVLSDIFARGRVSSGDVKVLIQELYPPDESLACDDSVIDVDPERLFDVGIAAYLLESHRSSFALDGLSADYLGSPLPSGTEDNPEAAVLARAAAGLAAELERRLEADESTRVMRDIEMPLVPVLARMERAGVGLAPAVLDALAADARQVIDTLRAEIHDLAGGEFTIDSPKQLAEVLFERLSLPTGKKTKTGFSTDASVLANLAPLHPIAEKVIAYREFTKLLSTYLEALPRMVGGDGRLHTSFNQTVAATGRLSSSNPNLQNIPVRTDLGRRIREAFVPAKPGDVIVAADYSQIELRVLAHLSRDQGLVDAFTSGADFHAATASRVFGVPLDAVEPGMRAKAKAVNFGIVYGQTAHGLSQTLDIPNAEAQAMIDRYYAAYPGVRAFLDETVAAAHRDGFAFTMFGRKRHIPELRSSNHNLRNFGERTAMNHPMQGTAADIIKLAMIEVDKRLRAEGFASRMVLQVHDELVFEAPPEEVERLSAMVCEAMGSVADLAVPLEVSVAHGPNWAAAK